MRQRAGRAPPKAGKRKAEGHESKTQKRASAYCGRPLWASVFGAGLPGALPPCQWAGDMHGKARPHLDNTDRRTGPPPLCSAGRSECRRAWARGKSRPFPRTVMISAGDGAARWTTKPRAAGGAARSGTLFPLVNGPGICMGRHVPTWTTLTGGQVRPLFVRQDARNAAALGRAGSPARSLERS